MNGAVATPTPWKAHWSGCRDETGPAWNLYCGDAGQVLAELPANRYGCVITSPPYYWQRDYGVRGQLGLQRTIDGYVSAIGAS